MNIDDLLADFPDDQRQQLSAVLHEVPDEHLLRLVAVLLLRLCLSTEAIAQSLSSNPGSYTSSS